MTGRPGTMGGPPTPHGAAGRLLAVWVAAVARRATWVVLAAVVAVACIAWYAAGSLRVNTSTADMISEHLDWRRTFIDLRSAFPELTRNVLVVIDAETPELAADAQRQLGTTLAASPQRYWRVTEIGAGPFFDRNALLFLPLDDLEALLDDIAAAQPLLGRLSEDFSVAGLLALLSQALESQVRGFETGRILDELGEAFASELRGGTRQVSWRRVMAAGDDTPGDTRRHLLVHPRLDFTRPAPRRDAIAGIRAAIADSGVAAWPGVRVRLTGPVAMEYEELVSVSEGMLTAIVVSLTLVAGVLYLALRSAALIVASLVTLTAGLIGTAGVAAALVGSLNLISLAFAVLYIGLGIDFSIHYCARYRELVRGGLERGAALAAAAGDIGTSLAVCTVTTAIGFYAFIPTDFSGVAQLGLISGTGMFVSFFATLTLLPALIVLLPEPSRGAAHAVTGDRWLVRLGGWVAAHTSMVRRIAALVGAVAVLLVLGIRFDDDPMNLRDPGTESVSTFRDLRSDGVVTPVSLSALVPGGGDPAGLVAALEADPMVSGVRSIASFVPARQHDKLALIDELALILGGMSTVPGNPRVDAAADIDAVRTFTADLSTRTPLPGSSEQALASRMEAWLESVSALPAPEREDRARSLSRAVLGLYPGQIARLNESLLAGPVDLSNLPQSVVSAWVAADGRRRLEVLPNEFPLDDAGLHAFVDGVRRIAPGATGIAVVQIEAGKVVLHAFELAFVTALVLIGATLLALLRHPRPVVIVVVQLLLAAALTGAAMVLAGVPLNFANVIALPLLLGVGVDSAIHMVHRLRTAPPGDGNLLATSTGGAVLYSAVTTACGFGSLVLSSHPGTASMGIVLALGMAMSLVCSLIVLPALLAEDSGAGG